MVIVELRLDASEETYHKYTQLNVHMFCQEEEVLQLNLYHPHVEIQSQHRTDSPQKNGVLRKLKHIFPNTYQRIKSICSPAKGGTGCYRFNYQPGS